MKPNLIPISLLLILLTSCNKGSSDPHSKIVIDSLSMITHSSVVVHISIEHDPATTSTGILYSETPAFDAPNTDRSCNKLDDMLGIQGLTPNREYYTKAWISVQNQQNGERLIRYSNEVKFRTRSVPIFTDTRDGHSYPMVEMNGLFWLAENLNYNAEEGAVEIKDNENNKQSFGRLYTHEAIDNAIPHGWRLPTRSEVENLIGMAMATEEGMLSLYIPGQCMYDQKLYSNRFGFSLLFHWGVTGDFRMPLTAPLYARDPAENSLIAFIFRPDGTYYLYPIDNPTYLANIRCVRSI
jgi:uncharacterized protein (TIGR02145 family)